MSKSGSILESAVAQLPGGGKLKFTEMNRLTKPGMPRSRWGLDRSIFKEARISSHSEKSWKDDYFQSAAIGQEFVIQPNPKVFEWVSGLICNWGNKLHSSGSSQVFHTSTSLRSKPSNCPFKRMKEAYSGIGRLLGWPSICFFSFS